MKGYFLEKESTIVFSAINRAIQFNFEDIVEDMIYILQLINDVKLFKEFNPDKLFVLEAARNGWLLAKVTKVLGDGIRKFLDYAIELKENHPEMFSHLLTDYELCSRVCFGEL